jgi:hypothetical protein
MKRWSYPFLGLIVAWTAMPAEAQQWQVDREQFGFVGRQLTIHVQAEAEGTIRIIRGAPGIVTVAGRSDDGLTAAGLTGRRDLTLTGVATGPLEYVVAVPERVRIDVRLPDRVTIESIGGHERSRTLHWDLAEPAAQPAGGSSFPAPEVGLGNDALFPVFAAGHTPRTVSLPDLRHVTTVTVRVEGDRFRVGASRPLALYPGSPDHLEIRPGAPAMEVVVVVPSGTGDFVLEMDGRAAMVVRGADIEVFCSPNTRQWLSGGRGWVTFSPVDRSLQCGPDGRLRHAI